MIASNRHALVQNALRINRNGHLDSRSGLDNRQARGDAGVVGLSNRSHHVDGKLEGNNVGAIGLVVNSLIGLNVRISLHNKVDINRRIAFCSRSLNLVQGLSLVSIDFDGRIADSRLACRHITQVLHSVSSLSGLRGKFRRIAHIDVTRSLS